MDNIKKLIKKELESLDLKQKVEFINNIRYELHLLSPFKNEPIDYVKWEYSENVVANDYNPNKVAPPEMELLEVSILNDGYTQPVVTWNNHEKNKTEVIDGFHRTRVGKESKIVNKRVMGYLPVVDIRKEQSNKNDRIASTIRHNRARGKHQVDAMSEIVIELKNRNWTNKRIAKQLGMDEEEVLRLCQISGLEHLFNDEDFSNAWISEDDIDIYTPISNDIDIDIVNSFRVGNTDDKNRIFHTYDKWECHKAGFYKSNKEGWSHQQCEDEFKRMNRIAWLGQAAVCYQSKVPSRYSSCWMDLDKTTREKADNTALTYLNKWMNINSLESTTFEEGASVGRQIELY